MEESLNLMVNAHPGMGVMKIILEQQQFVSKVNMNNTYTRENNFLGMMLGKDILAQKVSF